MAVNASGEKWCCFNSSLCSDEEAFQHISRNFDH
jgi:hypothetical protein